MVSFSPFATGPFGVPSVPSLDEFVPERIVKKIFEGSKNLWRQRIFAEIVIFLHEKLPSVRSRSISDYKPVCVEVVVFNPAVGAEAPHLYLSYSKLCHKFCKNISKFEMEHSESSNKFVDNLIVTYILNRIGVKSKSNSARISSTGERAFEIYLTPLDDDTGDSEMMISRPSMILADLPDLQKYRMVKKTVDESKNEFNSKLLLFHQESVIVNAEYEKAVRMSNLTTTAINCMNASRILHEQQLIKDLQKPCYTIHRKRWISAIEQVLLQNRVLKADLLKHRILISTPRKNMVPVTPTRSKPIYRRPSIIVSDEDSDSEKCLSECSTAADDGNGDDNDSTFKSKRFRNITGCNTDGGVTESLAQLSRAQLFMNSVRTREGPRSHSMVGVMPIKDPPLVPKLDIKQFGRQYRSCSVELMAPRCNDEKENSQKMFKESFDSVFSRTGPMIQSRKIAPLGRDRSLVMKSTTMKGFSDFSDAVTSNSQQGSEGNGASVGPVLRAMPTLPPLVDLAGNANARIRASKRFAMR